MAKTNKKDLMVISLDKGVKLYLSTFAMEGKSAHCINWLNTQHAANCERHPTDTSAGAVQD